jgi:hypothetical protein
MTPEDRISVLLTILGDHQISARADDGYTYSLLTASTASLVTGAYRAWVDEGKLYLEGNPAIECVIVERSETTLARLPYFPPAKR